MSQVLYALVILQGSSGLTFSPGYATAAECMQQYKGPNVACFAYDAGLSTWTAFFKLPDGGFRTVGKIASEDECKRYIGAFKDGARAMYLWSGNKDTLYRIHGTNEPWTMGTNVSLNPNSIIAKCGYKFTTPVRLCAYLFRLSSDPSPTAARTTRGGLDRAANRAAARRRRKGRPVEHEPPLGPDVVIRA
jgi:hypothetical protein